MNDLTDMTVDMEPEVEVDLASPWKRIGAALLNSVLTVLAYVPLIASVMFGTGGYSGRAAGLENMDFSSVDMTWLLLSMGVLLVYAVAQLYFMSRDGQSLGKKMLGIRVLKTNGTNPGFFGAVLMREVVYYLLLGLLVGVLAFLVQALTGDPLMFELAVNVLQLAAYVACLVMMFVVKNDRRTLQDYFANTVVVQLPKR